MATRQYIGARYVIKIYENTSVAGSAEWQNGTSYEPLTMVTYQNSSYLSKKDVPSNIGNPASNPTYWVVTGAYNGQIAALQSAIDSINSEISDINDDIADVISRINKKVTKWSNKRLLCLGDSYDEYGGGWIPKLGTLLGCDVVRVSAGSHGIIGYQTGQSYINLLRNATIANPETVTDVVICGGGNDRNHGYNDLKTAMQELEAYIRNRFPNVEKFYLGWLYYNYSSPAGQSTVGGGRIKYMRLCEDLHYQWLSNCEYIMLDFDNVRTGIDNYNHPSDEGVRLMSEFIAGALTGYPKHYCRTKTITGTWNSPFDDYNNPGATKPCFIRFDDNFVTLYLGTPVLSNSNGTIAGNTTSKMISFGDFKLPFKQTDTRFTAFLLPYNSTLGSRLACPVSIGVDADNFNTLDIITNYTIAGDSEIVIANQLQSIIYS